MAMTIGDYEILGRDRCGGAGLPYRVRHSRTGAFATLKVLPESGSAEDQLGSVGSRVDALEQVQHPSVLPVVDYGEGAGGAVFLVSPTVVGQSLSEILAEHAPLSVEETREICVDIAGALAAAHNAGVVHGALQPRSVLLQQDGAVFVTDFVLHDVIPAHATGSFLPTDDYVAPECAHGSSFSEASDAFALGAIMRECLREPGGAAPSRDDADEQSGFLTRVAAGLMSPNASDRLSVRSAMAMMSPQTAVAATLPASPAPIRSKTQRDIRLLYAPGDGGGASRRSRTIPLVAFGIVALVATAALLVAAAQYLGDDSTNRRLPTANATAALPTAVRRDEAVAPVVVTPTARSTAPAAVPSATPAARPATAVVPRPTVAAAVPTANPVVVQPPAPTPVSQARPTATSAETEELLAEAIVLRGFSNARFYWTRDVAEVADIVTGSALRTYQAEAARLRSIDASIESNRTELVFEAIQYSTGPNAYAQVTTVETWEHVDRRASTGEVLGSRRARARVTYGLVVVGERWMVESIQHTILSITPL